MTNFFRSSATAHQPLLVYVFKAIIAILLPIVAVTCLAALVLFVFVTLFITGLYLLLIHALFMGLGAVKGWIAG